MSKRFVLCFVLALAAASAACSDSRPEVARAAPIGETAEAAADPMLQRAQDEIKKSPDAPRGYVQLAAIFAKKARESGDFSLNSKAQAAVAKALEVAPDDLSAKKMQASLALTFHRFREALDFGTSLQQTLPDDPFVYGVLTDANVELGNYDDAVKAAQKMVDLRPNASAYARVAHLRMLYGDDKGAVEMYTTAARTTDPADKEAQSWALVQLGDQYWRSGKYPEAEKVYDEALQNFPNYYLAIAAKGRIRAAQGDLTGAEKFLTEAQNRVPNVDVIVMLGEVYRLAGKSDLADNQAKLLEAVVEKLGVAADRSRLALFWADRDERLADALAIAESDYATRKDIYTADIYAWSLYKNGRLSDAKKIIGEAMRLKTKDARIMYHAGMIDRSLGLKKSGNALLGAALDLNPAFDLLQSGIARAALAN